MSVEAEKTATAVDPGRYHESVDDALGPDHNTRAGVSLPGNHQPLQPALHDVSAHLRRPRARGRHELGAVTARIVDQVPNIARVVLHGVGEPMLVKELPRMVRYLKARSAYVLFNTNGTVLTPKKGRELCDTGLDELVFRSTRPTLRTFVLVRGKDYFNRIVRNVRAFTEMQRRERLTVPRVSLWLTGLKETIAQLADFVRIAHDIGVARGLPAAARVLRAGRHRHGAARPGAVRAAGRGGDAASAGGGSAGGRARHQLQRLGRHRARREPRAQGRDEPVVAVPAARGA